jgi:hypothetical protein
MKALLIATVLFASVAGCASKPITAHEVLFSSADTIKVQWDEILSNPANAEAIAREHCGSRDIELIDASSDAALYGLVKTRTWRCVLRPTTQR